LLKDEEIRRLEQVWIILSDFFQDLSRRNISVDVASDLRNCKTLIHLIRTSVTYSSKETLTFDDSLWNLLQILNKIRSNLISEALKLDETYVDGWMRKIVEAERTELDHAMIYASSEFVPGLPKDLESRWVRLTLQGPIAEERVQDVAEQFGVIIELKNDRRILIGGLRESVKKAAMDVYELSLQ